MSKPDSPVVRSTVPDVPDFMGTAGRVQTVSALLEQAQAQLVHFRAMRLLNNDQPDDEIPQPDPLPGQEKAPPVTYGDRIKSLENGIAALVADNEDIKDELIAAAVKRRQARAAD